MKYTLVKRVTFSYKGAEDVVSVVKEANSLEDALKYKVGAEMLEEPSDNKKFEILINIDDAFEYVKSINFDRQNTAKLLQAREIYNQSNGLQNISEHELKKFNELMKYHR